MAQEADLPGRDVTTAWGYAEALDLMQELPAK
jgi:hypothetical protein